MRLEEGQSKATEQAAAFTSISLTLSVAVPSHHPALAAPRIWRAVIWSVLFSELQFNERLQGQNDDEEPKSCPGLVYIYLYYTTQSKTPQTAAAVAWKMMLKNINLPTPSSVTKNRVETEPVFYS